MARSTELKKKGRSEIKEILAQLRAEGYHRVQADDVIETFEYLMGLDTEKLRSIWEDRDKPVFIRIACWVLANQMKAKDMSIIDKILDRAHGKPKQVSELTGKGGEEIIIRKIIENGTQPQDS